MKTTKIIEYVNKWLYDGKPFESEQIEDCIGFVYNITDLETGKFYIGKKLFGRKAYSTKNGKRKKKIVESDWKKYYSSSDEINQLVKDSGPSRFKREILRLCLSKSELTYYEAKYQFDYGVLLTENSYNKWIMCRIRKANMMR